MDQVLRYRTARGGDAISYEGYSYRVDRRLARGDISWRCLQRGCPGRLQTDGNFSEPIVRGSEHTHAANEDYGLIRMTIARCRERAATENTPIPQIYQEEANRLSASASASAMLPVFRSIDTSMYRARRTRYPRLPHTRAEIVVPESLRLTDAGENFMLLQMDDNDIMVFSAPSDFRDLCHASHVYMDGTFDTCPSLFRQLFTLHAFFGGRHVPLVEQTTAARERLQIAMGQRVQRRVPRYTRVNQNLHELGERYSRGEVDVLDYLTNVSYNLVSISQDIPV
ncbi:hypothetical protein R1sor_003186 [Riccia sorocarpa]|uniref:FLYWCH-type domain-containing protein n=1 Tax=Riccia sorocarpa TaxID=122646 RepID=A0ABD3H4R9_9MARC